MRVFISYHLADSKYRQRIEEMLSENEISYYAVPENANFTDMHHQHIRDIILEQMKNCTIVLCIVGKETYSRAHVDWELYTGLKGEVGKRKGLLAVMLEERQDNKNDIDYATFPPRIADNENYAVLEQFSSLSDRLVSALDKAEDNRSNKNIQTDNTRTPMPIKNKKYYNN